VVPRLLLLLGARNWLEDGLAWGSRALGSQMVVTRNAHEFHHDRTAWESGRLGRLDLTRSDLLSVGKRGKRRRFIGFGVSP
jgi:hypothetical protein